MWSHPTSSGVPPSALVNNLLPQYALTDSVVLMTHTYNTRTHAHNTHTHEHSRTCIHMHTHTHAYKHMHTHIHTCTHTHTCTLTHAHSHTHTTHTHAHTHTHTHAHSQLSAVASLSLEASYYNLGHDAWEPLLEPVADPYREGIYRSWTLTAEVSTLWTAAGIITPRLCLYFH